MINTDRGVSFTNNTTGDVIAVSDLTLTSDGDYLKIDTDDMTVVTSGSGSGEITTDFTGTLPTFETSTNSYTTVLTGGGASKTLVQSVQYNASYL